MKKLISVLLCLLLLFSLAGCGSEKVENLTFDTAKIELSESHTDFEGVDIKITNVIWNEQETKIEVDWTNDTDFEVLYGDPYSVELKEKDEWVSCQKTDELFFAAIGYILKPGKSQKVYNLTDTFDISKAGTYRLKTDCYVYNKGNDTNPTECELWAEFTVSYDQSKKEFKKTSIDFKPQYIRTNALLSDGKYPIVKMLRSFDDLRAYTFAMQDAYSLENNVGGSKDDIDFVSATKKYTEEYFKDNILVIIVLEEGSGSTRHSVEKVEAGNDGKLYVDIKTNSPEVGTSDMAQWHVLIEAKSDADVQNESDVVVSLDDKSVQTQPIILRQVSKNSNLTISIPYDWEYRTMKVNDGSAHSIEFWPKSEKRGKITLQYRELFAVPDILFNVEILKFGKYTAKKYTSGDIWSHIIFEDLAGCYVVTHENADKWLEEYNDQIMDILCSVKLAEGNITKTRATDLALQSAPEGYELSYVTFDAQQGMWVAKFAKKDDSADTKTLTITLRGEIGKYQ